MEATRLRLRACAAALAVVGLLCTSPARANGELLVSLDYQIDPGLTGCPSGADFRKAVVRQLGHDPFRDNAPRRMLVRLYSGAQRMAGRVEWRDANDQWEGERTFSTRTESCAEMARAMALATAIQIDLLALPEQAAPEKPAPEAKPPAANPPVVVVPPPVVVVTPAPAPPPKEPRFAVSVGVGALQDFGDAPVFVLPRLAISVGRPSALAVRLTMDGLGPEADVTRTAGVAELHRFVMTLELLRFFRAGRLIQPLVAAGLGWQDARAQGSSADAARDHEGQVVSGLLTASGGLAFSLVGRFSLIVELQALLYWPSVNVEVGSAQAAHLDGAAFFAHGGVLARF